MEADRPYDVTVIVSTRNRCEVLSRAIESLLAQDAGEIRYEVIIVDNGSTDQTQHVVRSSIARGHTNLRLLFEGTPGTSHGRNAGIKAALAPLLAFTDDDAAVDRHWVANIKRAFDEHPDLDYLTGKVVPRWEADRPSWLTSDNWGGPCVIRDRGDKPIYSVPGRFFPGWATVNMAIRRRVFDRVGLFSADFARGEDLEFILRVWRANGRGMYAPDVVVTHRIPANRMTKAYHRTWHTQEGEIRARLGYKETFDKEGRVITPPREGRRLLDTPAYVFRELLVECRRWLVAAALNRQGLAFKHECQVRQLVNYIRTRPRARSILRPQVSVDATSFRWP
jgi:glycosyltransferase involved in cell wall biosynthesis